MNDRKPQLNDKCPHCINHEEEFGEIGYLYLIETYEPYSEAHLCCSNCSSTYLLRHKVMYQDDINTLAVNMHDVLEDKLKEIGMVLDREDSDAIYDSILISIDKFGTGDYRNHN